MSSSVIGWEILILLYKFVFVASAIAFGVGTFQAIKGIRKEQRARERQGMILMIPSVILCIISFLAFTFFESVMHVFI